MTSRYSKQLIQIEGWEREDTFRFFASFSQPYFNVHTEIDITALYQYSKAKNLPVSLAYMHACLQAARATENFLYRIENNQVVRYSGLDISSTILRDDKNIAFSHFPYHELLEDFAREGASIIEVVRKNQSLFNGYQGNDLLHITTLPWFTFKGMEHAFSINNEDAGVPKIGFGKLEISRKKVMLPLSVGLHHALADGYHLHLFMKELEQAVTRYAD